MAPAFVAHDIPFQPNILTDIEFLLLTHDMSKTALKPSCVIYAGSFQSILAQMFPQFTFVVVDPEPTENYDFCPNVILYRDFYTESVAESIRDTYFSLYHFFFFSNISSTSSFNPTNEVRLQQDMITQLKWYHILQAQMSSLRFLPHAIPTQYLSGRVFLPLFNDCCRLVCFRDAKLCTYNTTQIARQITFFKHNVQNIECPMGENYSTAVAEYLQSLYITKKQTALIQWPHFLIFQ
jgi:hypothetical protein